ncbi:hypothetical protein [Mucilaginibacter ginsenosidivorax]|uniref:hypothetical protein n=1 Tax=Mucilaginibacter ginsenosidivorax TaxID=862126 RepID=UPI001863B751|nr:hypothetical protein [Mucilaginibacter ginsenosidivorax]
MPTVKKVIDEKGFYGDAIISDKVKDRSNDPYFVKKAEEAKEFLRKHPLPDHLRKK